MSRLFFHLECIGLLLLSWAQLCTGKFLSALLWSHYGYIIHVDLVDSVIGLSSIKLSENVCSHRVIAHAIATFLSSDHSFQLVIDRYLRVTKLLSEFILISCSL